MMKEIIIFDTEFTSWEGAMARNWSGDNEYMEIVQIAAIRINPITFEATRDNFNAIVKPVINPKLSQYFIDLTSIDNKEVEKSGVSFEIAANDFHEFCKNAVLYSFGDDCIVLNENIKLYKLERKVKPFKGEDITIWIKNNGIEIKPLSDGRAFTSGTFAEAVGAPFKTEAHYALNDTLSIQEALKYLVLEKGYPNPFILDNK